MIHKAPFRLSLLVVFGLLAVDARAERRSVVVLETSTSGRLIRVSVGSNAGLRPTEPVLFSENDKKVAAGRVFRVDRDTAIIAVLETYGGGAPTVDVDYEMLFGEPFDEAANLPDYVMDREEEPDNPANEKFLQPGDHETTPELDDDNYTPEVTLRPKFPDPRTYSPHNITLGLSIFRNRALPTATNPDVLDPATAGYSTYTGYTARYAYTFQTHYWLKARAPALMSVEMSLGIYNFDHTFPNGRVAQVRVMPLGFSLRYLIEVSKLFRLYPYLGYQINMVSATNGDLTALEGIQGGRLMGGAGAQLVMSDTIDGRVEGGSDGFTGALVVKF